LFVAPANQIYILQQGPTANVTQPDVPDAFWDAVETNSANALSNSNSNISPYPALYGSPLDWTGIISAYGQYNPGVSMIGLSYDNTANEIQGTITIDPTDSTIMLYTPNIATLPANTLPIINGIANPLIVAPGNGLPNAAIGQSYLITSDIGTAWPYDTSNSNATANVNDIITYSNSNAFVTTFSAFNNIENVQFFFDSCANLQYQWNGNAWVQGWYGPYDAASWRLIL
jgi:hypothetical protein